jgi:hypothetical protein
MFQVYAIRSVFDLMHFKQPGGGNNREKRLSQPGQAKRAFRPIAVITGCTREEFRLYPDYEEC